MQAQFQSPQRVYFVLGSDSDVNWVIVKDKFLSLQNTVQWNLVEY